MRKAKQKTLLEFIKESDPAAKNKLSIFLLYGGVHALINHRVSHFFYVKLKMKFVGKFIANIAKFFTGIEIHPAAMIGRALFIDHGIGVVIGETTIIGNYCTLYQGVTLGGTGKETGKRHPTIGDNVVVGAGAKVLGNITIGSNSKLAANCVVLKNVPANSTAVGVPAKIIKTDGIRLDI